MTMQSDDKSALTWLAYRYIADELPAEEIAAFEQRLAGDQQAREAVAEVVRLSQAVQSLPAEAFYAKARQSREPRQSLLSEPASPAAVQAVSRRSRWVAPMGWMAMGMAACLAVMMSIQGFQGPPGSSSASSPPTSDSSRLALAWTAMPEEGADAWEEDAPAIAADPADAAAESDQDFAAPGWLLAAVADDRDASASGNRVEEN